MTIYAIVIGLVVSLASGLLATYVGPPWRDAREFPPVATAIVVFVSWLAAYHFFGPRRSNRRTRDIFIVSFGAVAIGLGCLYGLYFHSMSYRDSKGVRHVKGTVETRDWKVATDTKRAKKFPEISVDPNLPDNWIERWTEKSKSLVEWWMLIYWLPLAAATTALVGIFAAPAATSTAGSGVWEWIEQNRFATAIALVSGTITIGDMIFRMVRWLRQL